eukprot:TRINITY_DN3441_c0_g1_i1.p1 TRINITY_DN3441_c0_g1~~TRINITY_DN3441_c0_g1_i1.p1  ORF type:complete len:471 (+),score=99.07 TRINITY_DN3441_c0_g1_i1:144-1556(+)
MQQQQEEADLLRSVDYYRSPLMTYQQKQLVLRDDVFRDALHAFMQDHPYVELNRSGDAYVTRSTGAPAARSPVTGVPKDEIVQKYLEDPDNDPTNILSQACWRFLDVAFIQPFESTSLDAAMDEVFGVENADRACSDASQRSAHHSRSASAAATSLGGPLVTIERPTQRFTCHAAVALQVLFSIRELVDAILKWEPPLIKPVKQSTKARKAMEAPAILCGVLSDMNARGHVEWPAMANLVSKMEISSIEQHDAEETLQAMIRLLPEDITIDALGSTMMHRSTCSATGCGYTSITFNPDYANMQLTVKDCFNNHIKEEPSPAWKCDHCGRRGMGVKQSYLTKIKGTLIIMLRRYRKRIKMKHKVEVTEELVVPLFTEDANVITQSQTVTFKPVLKVFHSGNTKREGHYTVDVLAEDGGWHHINDDVITSLSVNSDVQDESVQSPRALRYKAKNSTAVAKGQVVLVVYRRMV